MDAPVKNLCMPFVAKVDPSTEHNQETTVTTPFEASRDGASCTRTSAKSDAIPAPTGVGSLGGHHLLNAKGGTTFVLESNLENLTISHALQRGDKDAIKNIHTTGPLTSVHSMVSYGVVIPKGKSYVDVPLDPGPKGHFLVNVPGSKAPPTKIPFPQGGAMRITNAELINMYNNTSGDGEFAISSEMFDNRCHAAGSADSHAFIGPAHDSASPAWSLKREHYPAVEWSNSNMHMNPYHIANDVRVFDATQRTETPEMVNIPTYVGQHMTDMLPNTSILTRKGKGRVNVSKEDYDQMLVSMKATNDQFFTADDTTRMRVGTLMGEPVKEDTEIKMQIRYGVCMRDMSNISALTAMCPPSTAAVSSSHKSKRSAAEAYTLGD